MSSVSPAILLMVIAGAPGFGPKRAGLVLDQVKSSMTNTGLGLSPEGIRVCGLL